MKKILLSVILLTCGALYDISAHAQTTQPDAGSPEAVARGFYAFYLGELNKDNWSPLKKRREALKYMTPEFHRRAPRIIQQQMVDIIICAQDWDPKWIAGLTVGRAGVRGARATTVVTLPPFGGYVSPDNPPIRIKLTLVKRGSAWLVNATECLF
ncbi:MAG TPA: DUF3828 domain-containing protein [Pyrinomonadaceae bacterium]